MKRVLLSVLGPSDHPLRAARRETGYDHLVLFTPDPDGAAVERVRAAEGLTGHAPEVVAVDPADLLETLHAMGDAVARHRDHDVRFQVNGGGDNRLTHAALLTCFHHGVDALFCHEKGTTRLPVLRRAELAERFTADEKRCLSALHGTAEVDEVARAAGLPRGRAVSALLELKKKGLVEAEGPRVRANHGGRYYREHLTRGRAPAEGPG